LLFISPQRAQVRTCSLGRSESRTSHSDQSCAPTRQAIMPHTWSPHFEGRARHHNSIAMPVVPNYPTLCGAMAWSKACKVKPILGAEVRRAPLGPGLWPGPRRQARWAGRGSRVKDAAPDEGRERADVRGVVGPGMSATATQIATFGCFVRQALSLHVPGEGLRAAEDRGFEPRRVVTPNRISSPVTGT